MDFVSGILILIFEVRLGIWAALRVFFTPPRHASAVGLGIFFIIFSSVERDGIFWCRKEGLGDFVVLRGKWAWEFCAVTV